jgi:hypothetical protein
MAVFEIGAVISHTWNSISLVLLIITSMALITPQQENLPYLWLCHTVPVVMIIYQRY